MTWTSNVFYFCVENSFSVFRCFRIDCQLLLFPFVVVVVFIFTVIEVLTKIAVTKQLLADYQTTNRQAWARAKARLFGRARWMALLVDIERRIASWGWKRVRARIRAHINTIAVLVHLIHGQCVWHLVMRSVSVCAAAQRWYSCTKLLGKVHCINVIWLRHTDTRSLMCQCRFFDRSISNHRIFPWFLSRVIGSPNQLRPLPRRTGKTRTFFSSPVCHYRRHSTDW